MFDNALEHTRRGVVACVFDTSDRVQHMFYNNGGGHRRSVSAHGSVWWARPCSRPARTPCCSYSPITASALSDEQSTSTPGCTRTAILRYSTARQKAAATSKASTGRRTRAYCLGLSGLYINTKAANPRASSSLAPEAEALKNELIEKLTGLPDGDEIAIRQIYATNKLYQGPYLDAAPDLIVGYNDGYRTSWEAAVGQVTATRDRRQSQSLERRPLRRPAAGSRSALLQSQNRRSRPGHRRHGAHGSLAFRRHPARVDGRRPGLPHIMKRIAPAALLLLCLAGCGPPAPGPGGKRVIERHCDALPNLARLATTTPQSPVAWSTLTS